MTTTTTKSPAIEMKQNTNIKSVSQTAQQSASAEFWIFCFIFWTENGTTPLGIFSARRQISIANDGRGPARQSLISLYSIHIYVIIIMTIVVVHQSSNERAVVEPWVAFRHLPYFYVSQYVFQKESRQKANSFHSFSSCVHIIPTHFHLEISRWANK